MNAFVIALVVVALTMAALFVALAVIGLVGSRPRQAEDWTIAIGLCVTATVLTALCAVVLA